MYAGIQSTWKSMQNTVPGMLPQCFARAAAPGAAMPRSERTERDRPTRRAPALCKFAEGG